MLGYLNPYCQNSNKQKMCSQVALYICLYICKDFFIDIACLKDNLSITKFEMSIFCD